MSTNRIQLSPKFLQKFSQNHSKKSIDSIRLFSDISRRVSVSLESISTIVEVVARINLINVNINDRCRHAMKCVYFTRLLYFFFSLRTKGMTTIEFGGGPSLEARRQFSNLKDGSQVPK